MSNHLKFQNALAVGQRYLLSPFPAALRYSYSFPHSADFRFDTLVAGCRSSQSFDVPNNLAKVHAKKSAHELPEFGLSEIRLFPAAMLFSIGFRA
ncbi:hypothetical protein AVEN_71958-1 [Araneus ventricosus]|uniref:Uncharacterized protein n=1 Tax=Araneus ventricosus TaxID=182803 RepID=A0A4Y2F401_ARAVE|nr:hypothetical protein AVEN_71958-1 [Araneus ventricosus]